MQSLSEDSRDNSYYVQRMNSEKWTKDKKR